MPSSTMNEVKDLEILRREYRNMEMNRKTFTEESNSVSSFDFMMKSWTLDFFLIIDTFVWLYQYHVT